MFPINEIFDTIQGEAAFTGTPSTFVRFQFCDVGCPWCDTKHTWTVSPDRQVSLDAMLKKQIDGASYADLEPSALVEHLGEREPRHIVITGGEPCHYDLLEFTGLLTGIGKSVQIETSGTREIKCSSETWVTVSPKIDMPGGWKVRGDALDRANELKMPVGKLSDVTKAVTLMDRVYPRNPKPIMWLQPLSQSPKATELCIRAATEHGFRVSIQTHKFLGVR